MYELIKKGKLGKVVMGKHVVDDSMRWNGMIGLDDESRKEEKSETR
jgi:hypothetical protein